MFHVVVNPAGASGKTGKQWKKLEEILQKEHVSYEVHYSTPVFGIEDICRDLTQNTGECINLVIVGGDGTMNEAVNGITDLSNVRLGYIPAGSGNDLAHSLKLPKDRNEILRTIIKGEVKRTVDVGETTFHHTSDIIKGSPNAFVPGRTVVRRFMSGCGIGFDAHICQQVLVSKFKGVLNKIHLGKLVYVATAAKVIMAEKMVPFEVTTAEGTTYYRKCLFTVGMNEPYEGGGFRFCPSADDGDGKLTMCTADDMRKIDFFRIFPYAYNGNHLKFRGVTEYASETLDIKTEEPLWVHTDGEVACRSSHISMRILRNQLKLLM